MHLGGAYTDTPQGFVVCTACRGVEELDPASDGGVARQLEHDLPGSPTQLHVNDTPSDNLRRSEAGGWPRDGWEHANLFEDGRHLAADDVSGRGDRGLGGGLKVLRARPRAISFGLREQWDRRRIQLLLQPL